MPPVSSWKDIACSFLSNSGKPSAPCDLLLRLDLQSCLSEERLQSSAAVNTLQTKHAYQPVREGHIHKKKVSPRTKHTCYLVDACCLILPVVERNGGESQVYRGVLKRQRFRHAWKECGVRRQAFCYLYHAVCRIYSDQ